MPNLFSVSVPLGGKRARKERRSVRGATVRIVHTFCVKSNTDPPKKLEIVSQPSTQRILQLTVATRRRCVAFAESRRGNELGNMYNSST